MKHKAKGSESRKIREAEVWAGGLHQSETLAVFAGRWKAEGQGADLGREARWLPNSLEFRLHLTLFEFGDQILPYVNMS